MKNRWSGFSHFDFFHDSAARQVYVTLHGYATGEGERGGFQKDAADPKHCDKKSVRLKCAWSSMVRLSVFAHRNFSNGEN